jgi:hypothetical protein
LVPGGPINSLQLLATPGDPKSNFLRLIADFGCFLTSSTMILDYYAGSVVASPRDVNDWLNDQPSGFDGAHGVNASEVAKYAVTKLGVAMAFKGRFDNRDDVTVEKYICSGNPVMLKVSPCATQNQTTCPPLRRRYRKNSLGPVSPHLDDQRSRIPSHRPGALQKRVLRLSLVHGAKGWPGI